MSRLSDIALIAQVVATGSHRAFGQLVEAHQEAVRRFLLRLTAGDGMLADDLAQETFIHAWQGLKSFRAASNFQTWLLRIAYRVFLDEKRKEREAHPQSLPGEGSSDWASPSLVTPPQGGEGGGLLSHDLDRALATLSEVERTCVILQCVEGQSIKDIAAITGLNENTIKSHLLRGKKNMAAYLRRNGYG